MAKSPQRDRALLYPYMSYKTFRNFLDRWRDSTIPERIDTSVVPYMNGSNVSLLIPTLRYFGLITQKNKPTEEFAALVRASPEDVRQRIWLRLIKNAYSAVFGAHLELETTTTKQLTDLFRRGRSSETVRKSVTFFCLAAADAGLKMSPHIKPYAGRTRKRLSTKPTQNAGAATRHHSNSHFPELHIPPLPEFDESWSEQIKEKWFEAYNLLLHTRDGKET